PSACRGSLDRKTFPGQDPPPSGCPRRYTAAPSPPPDAPNVADETRDCVRRTSGPICVAEPASPPAGQTDPAPSGCPTCASRRPVWLFPLAAPVAVYRSHLATVPAKLASAASGSPVTQRLSCRRFPDCPYWPSLVVKPAGSSPARRPLPSVALLQPDFRFRISPCTIRSLPAEPLELHSSPPR